MNATKGFVTKHWIAFAVLMVLVIGFVVSYDHKNDGAVAKKIAKLPILGNFFFPAIHT